MITSIVVFLAAIYLACDVDINNTPCKQIYATKNYWEFNYTIDSIGRKYEGVVELKSTATIFEPHGQWAIEWAYDKAAVSHLRKYITSETTGAVETDSAVWIHPPRHRGFEDLQHAAFPLVRFPLRVGKEWDWDVTPKKCRYKVTAKEKRRYGAHDVVVWKVEASHTGDYGMMNSTYYFSPAYGFMELISRR